MNTRFMNLRHLLSGIFIFQLSILSVSGQTGTWTKIATNAPHDNQGAMILLTDGTVLCHNSVGGSYGTGWDKLTPNAGGSYVNGTWSTVASMNHDRLFFPTQVLPSGKVFAAGGEYGSGDTAGEVYDPVANTWTKTRGVVSKQNIYDGNSELLDNGTILVGVQDGLNPSYNNLYYNPGTNAWTTAPICVSPYNHDEAQWLKLPDYSVLFVGIASISSCRFIQSSATWVADGALPDSLFDKYGEEAGPAFMLPNGKAVFFGATGHNALYTPSGTSSPGTWSTAAFFPKIRGTQVGQTDAPSAMMVNGHILCACSPIGTSANNEFNNPIYFVEYNYSTNTFTHVTSPLPGLGGDSIATASCYQATMLDLPDGTVLMAVNQDGSLSTEYFVYTPGSGAIAQGKPTISNIAVDGYPTYKITGKLFNGISEGAAYGDDWQVATNYPLVRLTNGTNVYYAKTTNWNRIGAVQTDSLADTALFTLPASLSAGTYSLVVIANGFASNPALFTPAIPLSVSISSETEVLCNGNSTGSATANATGGTLPYTYTWAPGGGSSATKSGISAGTYTITVKDANANSASTSVTITQPSPLRDSISSSTCNRGKTKATAGVKGGISPYTYSWSPGGGTKATMSGLSNGTYTITVTDKNGCSESFSKTFSCAGVPPGDKEYENNDLNLENISLFPNPTKGQFILSGLEQGMNIEIYDYTGRKISTIVSSGITIQLDLSNQSNGIYLLRILSKEGTLVSQKKVVKTQ